MDRKEMEQYLCQLCGGFKHKQNPCLMCQKCGMWGHKTVNCKMCQDCGSDRHYGSPCPICQKCRRYAPEHKIDGCKYPKKITSVSELIRLRYQYRDSYDYICIHCNTTGHCTELCSRCKNCNTYGHGTANWISSCFYCKKCRHFGHRKEKCCWDWETRSFNIDLLPIETQYDAEKFIDINVNIPTVITNLIAKFTY